jgi:hypothetical protein
MNVADLNAATLGSIHQFASGTSACASVKNARLVTASMSEWPAYLTGSVTDAAGDLVDITCWFSENDRKNPEDFPKQFDAEVSGALFDYVKGVGFSMHNCTLKK